MAGSLADLAEDIRDASRLEAIELIRDTRIRFLDPGEDPNDTGLVCVAIGRVQMTIQKDSQEFQFLNIIAALQQQIPDDVRERMERAADHLGLSNLMAQTAFDEACGRSPDEIDESDYIALKRVTGVGKVDPDNELNAYFTPNYPDQWENKLAPNEAKQLIYVFEAGEEPFGDYAQPEFFDEAAADWLSDYKYIVRNFEKPGMMKPAKAPFHSGALELPERFEEDVDFHVHPNRTVV